jgi:DNA polymerase III alpha subunit (gram-positive type)
MHYLAFDLETGGLDNKKHSIMEAYFAIYDENERFIEDLYLKIKPDNGIIVYEEEAIKVTGIDPEELLKNPSTVTYTEAKARLLTLLNNHKIKGKRNHYRVLGQNIGFDLGFIFEQLVDKEDWEKIVHRTPIDTYIITTFLRDCGMMPEDVGSLSSLAEYFGIPLLEAHSAKDDVKMTVSVYFKMKELMKSTKKGLAVSFDSEDIFSIIEE